jgi:lysophospholipase L1-like esterase
MSGEPLQAPKTREPSAAASSEEGRVARALKLLLLLSFALVVCAAGGTEWWLRRHLHPPAIPQQHVFLLPPLRRMQVHVGRDVPGLAKRETLVTINALGLRGDELDLEQHDAFRIVTLGGSVTECMVLSDADAWPRRLQGELAQRTGKPVWVGNAGRSGQTTLDYIAHAQVLLPAFAPDMVVIMPGGNDLQAFVENRYFPLDLEQPALLARYMGGTYARGDTMLLEPLFGYYMAERYFDTTTTDLGPLYTDMKARRFAAKKLPSIPDLDEALDVYRSNLRSLFKMLRRLSSKPQIVFMTHPFLWREGMRREEEMALWAGYTCMDCPQQAFYAHEALAQALRQFNQELLRFCGELELACFDLEPKLPKTLENFYDDAHLKEPGAKLTAALLATFIAQKGLVSSPGAVAQNP